MSNCSHVYDRICHLCGDDCTMAWITCSKYKSGCMAYVCTLCGEVDAKASGLS
jgi:hypothetical protein